MSETSINKIIDSKKEYNKINREICNFCGGSFDFLNYKKHHGENCNLNTNKVLAEIKIHSCPFCQKEGVLPQIKVYHFDNCKQNPNYLEKLLECPHCGEKSGVINNMKRYHFDNCINNPNLNKSKFKICPHCNKEGRQNMERYHFDKCKFRHE